MEAASFTPPYRTPGHLFKSAAPVMSADTNPGISDRITNTAIPAQANPGSNDCITNTVIPAQADPGSNACITNTVIPAKAGIQATTAARTLPLRPGCEESSTATPTSPRLIPAQANPGSNGYINHTVIPAKGIPASNACITSTVIPAQAGIQKMRPPDFRPGSDNEGHESPFPSQSRIARGHNESIKPIKTH